MDFFAARRVPFMARSNYLIEVRHLLLWGAFAGMFEGSVSSIVAAKTFDAGPWLITIIMATPMFANLMGLVWGSVATRRRKLPVFLTLAAGAIAMIGSVALAPRGPVGGWVFAGQILVARVLLSGCMTVRSGLWKHNYPAASRGRIAARLQFVRFSLAIGTVITASALFDLDPGIYVYVYPIAALIGGASLLIYRRTHVRGEHAVLAARERDAAANGPAESRGFFEPVHAAVDVLRSDRSFRRYCTAMMLLGSGNIMVMPLMTILVTKQMQLSYFKSCGLLEVLPRILMMASLMPWAAMFDRVGVVRFRVVNAVAWIGSAVFAGVAAFLIEHPGLQTAMVAAVVFVALSRMCEGVGKGGGAIAWNIGHLHFADSDRAETYMGTHVFLTGIRGMIAPFLGTLLYTRYGWPAFAVAVAFGLAGANVFRLLARDEQREAARKQDSARAESAR